MNEEQAKLLDVTTNSDKTDAPGKVATASEKVAAQVGGTLGHRYKLLAESGYGGMGKVFRALDTKTNELCAVKVMHNHLQASENNIKRFEREAEIAIDLKHDNIVALLDYGFCPSQEPFIVMEFLQGHSLDDLIKDYERLPLDLFALVFKQVCRGLSYAHESGVVHRDIKPSNIMIVERDGVEIAKIVDFGIARVCKRTGIVCPTTAALDKLPPTQEGLSQEEKDALQALTQPGEIFGSPLYMSPEQCQGEEADCRSEVYSLGCMMFESLTGKPPLKGETAVDTLLLRVNEDAPPINSVVPGVTFPKELEAVVAKSLERHPHKRYQEVHELLSSLEEVL